MKKIKTILTTISVFVIFSLIFVQKSLADILPHDGGWSTPSRPGPKNFIDVIEPQHIIIGGAVLTVVIASFIVLFKIRKK